MSYEGVSGPQALRLVCAYGLRDGALATVVPVRRPPYVPYMEDVGQQEWRRTSPEMRLAASKLWHQGLTIKNIAAELHLPYTTVASLTKHRDLFPRRNRERRRKENE